jgi:hypothetical protein
MRVACSLFSSALLVFSNFQPVPAQSPQQTNDQQSVQKPEVATLKQPLAFGLEDGTPIKLRITRNLSSADATTGDRVDFEVLEDIKVKDVIVVPRGGLALATVTEAQSKRRMARGGKLDVNIDDVRLADGEKAPLRAVKEVKGGGHTGAMTGAMVATAIVFFPAAPLFLFMKGKDITIPKGTEITAYVNGDIPLDPTKFQTQPVLAQPSPAVVAAQNGNGGDTLLSSIEVKSTPDGADIFVDGEFVGDTPSTLNVSSGKHAITVKKLGFQEWVRNMNFHGGSITLNAELTRGTDETPTANAPAMPAVKSESPVTAVSPSAAQNSPGWIGVSAQNGPDGALVTGVSADGPGAEAGIKVGDMIQALDGRLIKGKNFENAVASLKPGTKIVVNYIRGDSTSEARVTVGTRTM